MGQEIDAAGAGGGAGFAHKNLRGPDLLLFQKT